MKIMWVVGFVVPEAACLTGESRSAFGGWVSAMLQQLARVPGIELGVAMRAPVTKHISQRIGNIQYYALPQCGRGNHDIPAEECRYVLDDFKPDLLHVEGTECTHALTFLSCWMGRNVVELQGIINGHEPYQYGGLPVGAMLWSFHPVKAMVAAALIFRKRFLFMPRLPVEIDSIRKAQHLIGRTTWDRAHAYAVNPVAPYYHCNHVLRDPFYHCQWEIGRIQRYSLFIGNAATPLKGAHFALRAVAQLKREYPDIKLYIAGDTPHPSSWKEYKKYIGYAAYLRLQVRELGLQEEVEFTGVLQANQMAERMSGVHIYVLSSTIENSPTTLSEAMLMGVPTVTAYVGGTPDMARDGEEVLFYRDNDPAMLAYQIKRIFDDDVLALRLSANARSRALVTHDQQANFQALLQVYRAILQQAEEPVSMRHS